MKHIWILLLAALLLLTACNPATPPVEGNGNTTESQTAESADRVLGTDDNGDYPIVEDLLLSDFDTFVVGKSTKEEIYSHIGNPHGRLPTSGFYVPVWGTQDGYFVLIRFDNNQILTYLKSFPISPSTETT